MWTVFGGSCAKREYARWAATPSDLRSEILRHMLAVVVLRIAVGFGAEQFIDDRVLLKAKRLLVHMM